MGISIIDCFTEYTCCILRLLGFSFFPVSDKAVMDILVSTYFCTPLLHVIVIYLLFPPPAISKGARHQLV